MEVAESHTQTRGTCIAAERELDSSESDDDIEMNGGGEGNRSGWGTSLEHSILVMTIQRGRIRSVISHMHEHSCDLT